MRDSGADVLIVEARGDGSNSDYAVAVRTVLERLSGAGVPSIAVQVFSSRTRRDLDDEDRLVRLDGNATIALRGRDADELRLEIGAQVARVGRAPGASGSGNREKRLLIDAGLSRRQWLQVLRSIDPSTSTGLAETAATYGPALLRPQQPGFRRELLRAYRTRCAVTSTSIAETLEAAHISPYARSFLSAPTNGLLLRRDVHALFDADLLGIDPDYRIRLSPRISDDAYAALDGSTISLPDDEKLHPDRNALDERFSRFPR